ncbi:hypothetical protein OAA06_02305, partial [bacterium]|nr:hypothetical protein [bacterium]
MKIKTLASIYKSTHMQLSSSFNRRIFINLFSVLCFSLSSLYAQIDGFKVLNISAEDGLAQNTVHCIMQDSKGFIWLGTRTGGLDRYDGYSFKNYRVNPYDSNSICSNEIFALFEDSRGRIWAGSRNVGVSVYDPIYERFTNYESNLKDSTSIIGNFIYDFVEDSKGRIWIATDSGLCFYDYACDQFTHIYNDIQNRKFSRMSALAVYDKDHMLLAEYNGGLTLFNITTQKVVKKWEFNPTKPSSLSLNTIFSLLVDDEKRIWCGMPEDGLDVLANIDSDNFLHISSNIRYDNRNTGVHDMIQDNRGNIWVTTPRGLFFISKKESHSHAPKYINYTFDKNDFFGLSSNSLYNIIEDKDGQLWIGTWNDGVDYVTTKPTNFKQYRYKLDDDRFVNSSTVYALCKDDKEVIVGVLDGGLNVLDLKTQKYSYYTFSADQYAVNNNKSFISQSATSVFVNSEGFCFVGTPHGFDLFNRKEKTFKHFFKDWHIRDVDEGPNHLWMATRDEVFIVDKRLSGNNPYTYSQKDFLELNQKGINRVLYRDEKDFMWLGTHIGLFVYTEEAKLWKKFSSSSVDTTSLSNNKVMDISEDADKNIWIATANGLNVFNRDKLNFTTFNEWHGLPFSGIDNVFSDHEGYVWISTIKGLTRFKYNPQGATRSDMLEDVKTFTKSDGLVDTYCTPNSSFVADDGEVFIGSVNGFNSFYPDRLMQNKKVPDVVLCDFKLFNKTVKVGAKDSPLKKSIAYSDEITLNYKQSV